MLKVSCILLITILIINIQSFALPLLNFGDSDVGQIDSTSRLAPAEIKFQISTLISKDDDKKDHYMSSFEPTNKFLSFDLKNVLLSDNDDSDEKSEFVKRAAESKTETKGATCPHCNGKGCPSCRDGQTRIRSKANVHQDTFQQESTKSNPASHSSPSRHNNDKSSSPNEKQGEGKNKERS